MVIYGHGFGDSQWGGPTAVAPTLAQAGFATVAINAVGHGFGPLSQVIITDNQGNTTTLTAGGRTVVDLNGDGQLDGPYEELPCRESAAGGAARLSAPNSARSGGTGAHDPGRDRRGRRRESGSGRSMPHLLCGRVVRLDVRDDFLGDGSGRAGVGLERIGGGSVEDIVRWSQSYHSLAAEILQRASIHAAAERGHGLQRQLRVPAYRAGAGERSAGGGGDPQECVRTL